MARIRSIKPQFFTDDEVGALSMAARLLFIGLWCEADREGRLEDRPKRLKTVVLPYDDMNIDALLNELACGRFILRYKNGGKAFIAIRSFAKHQHVHVKEPASAIPAPDESGSSPVQEPAESGSGPLVSGLLSLVSGHGKEEHPSDACAELDADASTPAPDSPEPSLVTLPCVGTGTKVYGITQSQIDAWISAYPAVDVLAEIRKAKAWLDANPSKRKTARGAPRFLVNWLSRAQDRPNPGGSGTGPVPVARGYAADVERRFRELEGGADA